MMMLRALVPLTVVPFALAAAGCCFAQQPASIALSNDKLELRLLPMGASLASMVALDDTAKLNPLWTPERRNNGGYGHFICLDGFGGMSPEETKAGLQGHGEMLRTTFDVSRDGSRSVTLSATLPLVQERVSRTYELRDGQSVVYVKTKLESLVAFDRPIAWAEHATIGSPFLERGVTAVDQSSTKSQSRPYPVAGKRTLASGRDFTWPNGPLASGGVVDLRKAPMSGDTMNHTTTALDLASKYQWVTAVNPKLRRVVGWIWRTADFPWLQDWQNYSATGVMARGLEFSTQPYDVPRREAVAMNPLLGNPTFRWLPAKSTVETEFALFYATVPEGFDRVTGVKIAADGSIVLEGAQAVTIPASVRF